MKQLLGILTAVLMLGHISAQVPVVPPEFLDETLRLDGDHLRVCIFKDRATTAFDADIAAAVADSLLLTHELVYIPASFPLFDDSDFFYALFLHLTNDCDMFAGISLTAGVYPDWLMATGSYYSSPFVLAVTDSAYQSLADVPTDKSVGVQMGGVADMEFLRYYTTREDSNRWTRLPYADQNLMLERLADGTIAAALIWFPDLIKYTGGDFEARGIRLAELTPLNTFAVELAFVFLGSDPFLGDMVNQAIDALSDSGVISELASQYGFEVFRD